MLWVPRWKLVLMQSLLSTAHALACCGAALWKDAGGFQTYTDTQVFIAATSGVYFAVDLAAMAVTPPVRWDFVVHHCLVVALMVYNHLTGGASFALVGMLWWLELSTVLLGSASVLGSVRRHIPLDTASVLQIEAVERWLYGGFAALFVGLRIVKLGVYLGSGPSAPTVALALFWALYGIQWWWLGCLVRRVAKRLGSDK
jgi:hypothetical protein